MSRTHQSGAPWEALQLAQQAQDLAALRGSTLADKVDVERPFQLQQIDEQGLRWIDRAVIKALLNQPKYRSTKDGNSSNFVLS